MYGGPGNDLYFVEHVNDRVMEVLERGAGGDDTVRTSLSSFTAPANVEAIELIASVAGLLSGNGHDNRISGNSQGDALYGLSGNDQLWGLAGNDTLDGGTGRDSLIGGQGDDSYFVDTRSDLITESTGGGFDTVYSSASYVLPAHLEKLVLTGVEGLSAGGNSLANWLVGNSGNNTLSGGLGADTLEGGLGDDTYVVNERGDVILDTGGLDTVRSSISWVLAADLERLELTGLNSLEAHGNAHGNVLMGNVGDNVLDGAGGSDTLMGGAGSDAFVLSNPDGMNQLDRILDFDSGEDLLILNASEWGLASEALSGLSGLVAPEHFVVGAGAVPLDDDDRVLFDTVTHTLWLDVDGWGIQAAKAVAVIESAVPANTDIFWGL